jgi:hypothetical protein
MINDNFVKLAIDNGYSASGFKGYNPLINWYGLDNYKPDVFLKKNDNNIVISLNGNYTPIPKKNIGKIFENYILCKCRYIKITISNKVIFETWSGRIPNRNILNKITNQ